MDLKELGLVTEKAEGQSFEYDTGPKTPLTEADLKWIAEYEHRRHDDVMISLRKISSVDFTSVEMVEWIKHDSEIERAAHTLADFLDEMRAGE